MEKIKTTLWKDYDEVTNRINNQTDDNVDRKTLYDERDKIRNEIIKLEQSILEADVKRGQLEAETKFKAAQIEAENKREKLRNQISVGTFTITTIVSVYAIVRTFRFDQEATVTSTLGRNILNGAIPKMFKR